MRGKADRVTREKKARAWRPLVAVPMPPENRVTRQPARAWNKRQPALPLGDSLLHQHRRACKRRRCVSTG
jgi:hypothetical protein